MVIMFLLLLAVGGLAALLVARPGSRTPIAAAAAAMLGTFVFFGYFTGYRQVQVAEELPATVLYETAVPAVPSPPMMASPPAAPSKPRDRNVLTESWDTIRNVPQRLSKRSTKRKSKEAATTREATAEVQDTPTGSMPDWVHQGEKHESDRDLKVVTGEIQATEKAATANAMQRAFDAAAFDLAKHDSRMAGWKPRTIQVVHSYVEPIDRRTLSSDTPFRVYRAHLQIELSNHMREIARKEWRRDAAGDRLWVVGAGVGFLTLVAGTFASFFRIDARTGGRHRPMLIVGSAIAIVVGFVAAASCVESYERNERHARARLQTELRSTADFVSRVSETP